MSEPLICPNCKGPKKTRKGINCTPCSRLLYRLNNRALLAARTKDYYYRNKEKEAKRTAVWREKYRARMNDASRNWYHRNSERQLELKRQRPEEVKIAIRKRYNLKNAEKNKARSALGRAVRKGEVQKTPCVVCGEHKSEGHHSDYSKPLEVIWLCRTHHHAWERIFC